MRNREKNALTVSQLAAAGHDIGIRHMSGRPRIESIDGSRDVSPRLTEAEMRLWLQGFEMGATSRRAIDIKRGHWHSDDLIRVGFWDTAGYLRCMVVKRQDPDKRSIEYIDLIWDAAAKACGMSVEAAQEELFWGYLPTEKSVTVILD
jgi:hypothetical protein